MFELIVKCSKEVKKIVIDFGDSSQSVMEMAEPDGTEPTFDFSPPKPKETVKAKEPQRDISDIIAERAASSLASKPQPVKTEAPKESSLPKIDIANRPPAVDEDFNKGY